MAKRQYRIDPRLRRLRKQRAKRAKEIGKRIKKARTSCDPPLHQRDLAEAAGVSQAMVHNWEAGKCHPQDFHLAEMAKRLGLPVEWLRAGEAA